MVLIHWRVRKKVDGKAGELMDYNCEAGVGISLTRQITELSKTNQPRLLVVGDLLLGVEVALPELAITGIFPFGPAFTVFEAGAFQ